MFWILGLIFFQRIGGIVCDDRLIVISGAAPSLEEAYNRLLLHAKG